MNNARTIVKMMSSTGVKLHISTVAEDYSDLEIDESADGDEFIFYNGKMMKRSYLLKLKKEAEERKNAK